MMLLEDLMICARTVYGEARGESPEGRRAVAHVMINRWRSSDGQFARDDTLASACLRHLQFSTWNKGDPNFATIQAADLRNSVFRDCVRAVLEAVDAADDPTRGARHYHTIARPAWARSWPPEWAEGHEPSAAIGAHVFYSTVR